MRTKEEINKLVEENISLVDFMLYKHFKIFISLYPSLVDDIKQEGCLGLMKAAEKFDESKGSFTTVATFYIRNAMLRFYSRKLGKYSLKDCISTDIEIADDITLLDSLVSEDIERDYRTNSIVTRSKYSEVKDIDKIIELVAKGYSQEEIGKRIGVNQVQVSRRISKFRQEIIAIEKLCKLTHSIKVS